MALIHSLRDRAPRSGFNARDEGVRIPVEIQDAVTRWARSTGRAATAFWDPITCGGCVVVEITLKPEDPRMRAYQEGRLGHEPTDRVYLWRSEPNDPAHPEKGTKKVAIPMGELGGQYVEELLAEADVQSGRGLYKSMQHAVQAVDAHNQKLRAGAKHEAVENSRLRAREHRRQVFDLPLVSVAADLGDS